MIKRKNWPKLLRRSPTLIRFAAPGKDKIVKWFDPKCHGRAQWFIFNFKNKGKRRFGTKKLLSYILEKPADARQLVESLYDEMEHKKNDKIASVDARNKKKCPWVSVEPVVIETED